MRYLINSIFICISLFASAQCGVAVKRIHSIKSACFNLMCFVYLGDTQVYGIFYPFLRCMVSYHRFLALKCNHRYLPLSCYAYLAIYLLDNLMDSLLNCNFLPLFSYDTLNPLIKICKYCPSSFL